VREKDLISLYTNNDWVKELIKSIRNSPRTSIRLKGLSGSLPAVLGATLYKLSDFTQVFILQDKEEAAYLYTDLLNLLNSKQILLYPALEYQAKQKASLATAANLMRNEILQQLKQKDNISKIIVTYPEAIVTQVIGQESLIKNTWSIQVGEKITLAEFVNKLIEKGFEKVDFIYEAGQFATRGGIIDIFSYANQLPYRIELLGNDIESIRTFNPSSQLSIENIQKALLFSYAGSFDEQVSYQSFLDFLPSRTLLWFKDYEIVFSTIKDKHQESDVNPQIHQLETTLKNAQETLIVNKVMYESIEAWEQNIQKFTRIEFGSRSHLESTLTINYKTSPQPNFNQQFNLLAENLQQNQKLGLENFILAESTSQFERLASMFEELDVDVHFKTIPIGLSQGYIDHQVGIACYTDHQIFGRYYRYKTPQQYSKSQAFTLKELNHLQPGDYVVHIDHGIARFAGLSKVEVNDKEQEVLRLVYKDNDVVYLSLHALHKISKYTGKEGLAPAMSKLGSTAWEQKKKKVKHKVQYIAKELIQLYSKRRYAPGFAFSKDTFMQAEMESSFIYEDTPDQAAATADVKKNMEMPHPMDRLVCGDVGFGKTEVAIRASFKAVQDRKQVAVLVPTTILALQHYESFKNRLANFPLTIEYINRFKPKQEIKNIQQALTEGKIDILIGTHTILGKTFQFKDLGLLVVDEEQKFGVKAKDRIKEFKVNVDVLTLTATPIPRTLHFSLMGARDLSIIATSPSNRQPVQTSIHTFDKKVIQEAIHYEVQRGGQVFFVHNRVANIREIADMLHKLVPEYRIGIAHGQMDGDQLEKKMLTFIAGGYDILVSTNIIESGLDIPNANTIIINDSHMFGLSDLHQMRGRVGRSNKKAFCYLIAPPSSSLTEEARKRLATLEEFTELGDGFKVAMRDLDIRGAGNLLGAEQSGFIADVGFEAYCKILEEAVQELKENEFKELFAEELARKGHSSNVDCTLETDLELLIPNGYVSNDTERLRLYTKLDNIENEQELEKFQDEMQDRFGKLPTSVQELIKAVKLRWVAKKLCLQKIRIKDNIMRCYFISSPPKNVFAETLTHILDYVQKYPQRCQLKELKNQLSLTVSNLRTVEEAYKILELLANGNKNG
jgi:transcription-repair coupling factor (superfamily II helicase)